MFQEAQPSRRLPVYILVDRSGSMDGEAMIAVNQGREEPLRYQQDDQANDRDPCPDEKKDGADRSHAATILLVSSRHKRRAARVPR